MATSTKQVVATVPVYDYLQNPGDALLTSAPALQGRRVKVTLAYDKARSIAPVTWLENLTVYSTLTDQNGFWQVNVVPTDNITPANTYYIVEIEGYLSYKINPTLAGVPGIGWQSSAILLDIPASLTPGGQTITGPLTVTGLASLSGGVVVASSTGMQVNAGGDISARSLSLSPTSPYAPSALAIALAGVASVSGDEIFMPPPSGGDDSATWQAVIGKQQLYGGRLRPQLGTYLLHDLIPAPGTPGAYTDSTRPLLITGGGMQNTTLKINAANASLFASGAGGQNPKIAQIICTDLTIDGNYSGVGGGAYPQASSNVVGMVSTYFPYTSAAAPGTSNGLYHEFERVRFYRPQGFVSFPSLGFQANKCVFDSCGQPDIAPGGTHIDNLGGAGDADSVVDHCAWINSSGNYADFVPATGHPVRLTFDHNTSVNHQIGGIYAAGKASIINGNKLANVNAGSGVGYDSSGATDLRANNIVTDNTLVNMLVNGSGLSPILYGDVVFGNVASDSLGGAPVKLYDNLLTGTSASIAPGTLPTQFRSIVIEWYARVNAAVTTTSIYLRFNGDGGNNYDYQALTGSGATAAAAETLAASLIAIGAVPGTSATAGYFAQGRAEIENYTGVTGNKVVTAHFAVHSSDGAGSGLQGTYSGKWRTTATPITSLVINPGGGSFVAGSWFCVWGLP